ncbi:MAG: MFS transporter [Acidobacteria bacterium]|nr:MFS transporter [Acidobacteriota bacterium]
MTDRIARTGWTVAILLCLSTMINYVDRSSLSIVSVEVMREFDMNQQDFGNTVAVFMFGYAIMYALSGYVVDRLGTHRGFLAFITAWSVAQMLHAAAAGRASLAGCRLLLGLSEPGNWPAAARAIREWFPAGQRALGIGIFNSGSSLGAAVAPGLVAALTLGFGWRAAFVVTGALGLVLAVFWMFLYRPGPFASAGPAARPDWRWIIRQRGCWTLILARFFTDPVVYFVISWLPAYLRTERGFDLAMVGKYGWVPYIFGDIGYILGGWLSGRLIAAGWTLPRARKFVMAVGAAVMPLTMLAPWVPEAWMVLAVMSCAAFGHAFWIANLLTIPTDIFGEHQVGTASGFTGAGGAIGGVLANLGTGYIVRHYSYTPIFLMAGLMHPIAIVLVYRLLKDREFERASAGA